jgi:hypothetical protein
VNRQSTLLRQLANTKANESSSIQAYLDTMCQIASEINEAGQVLSEALLGAFMLAGLPKSMESYVMSLEASGEAITSSLVMEKLLLRQVGDLVSSDMNSSENGDVALLNKKAVVCHKCNKPGHYANSCRSNGNKSFNPRSNKNADKKKHFHKESAAFLNVAEEASALKSETSSNIIWYIDSGASNHMTSNKNILFNTKSASYAVRQADDSQIVIQEIGDTEIAVGDMDISIQNI